MKKWMSSVLLASWLVGGIGFALSGNAQGQSPVINGDAEILWTGKADMDEILKDIGYRATRHIAEVPEVDVVFVVDGSLQMVGSIGIVERNFVTLLDALEKKTLDYRFAMLAFRLVKGQPNVKLLPWTFDRAAVEKQLSYIRRVWRGDFETGHGLDALMQGLNEFRFKADAITQFVIITNSPLTTIRPEDEARKRMIEQIINSCYRDKVQLNFIGIQDSVQIELAGKTGGKWYPIIHGTSPPLDPVQILGIPDRLKQLRGHPDRLNKTVYKIFEQIAEFLIDGAPNKLDIVFLFDCSRSMRNRVDAVCDGLDEMVTVLNAAQLDYRFGVIRFWAKPGLSGQSTVLVSKPPLKVASVKKLFRRPKAGTERLLDAIVEGVPKLRTPTGRSLVLIIVTDEPTNKDDPNMWTVNKAIEVCQGAQARVYVLGGLSFANGILRRDPFQRRIAVLTKGAYYTMRGAPMFDLRLE